LGGLLSAKRGGGLTPTTDEQPRHNERGWRKKQADLWGGENKHSESRQGTQKSVWGGNGSGNGAHCTTRSLWVDEKTKGTRTEGKNRSRVHRKGGDGIDSDGGQKKKHLTAKEEGGGLFNCRRVNKKGEKQEKTQKRGVKTGAASHRTIQNRAKSSTGNKVGLGNMGKGRQISSTGKKAGHELMAKTKGKTQRNA